MELKQITVIFLRDKKYLAFNTFESILTNTKPLLFLILKQKLKLLSKLRKVKDLCDRIQTSWFAVFCFLYNNKTRINKSNPFDSTQMVEGKLYGEFPGCPLETPISRACCHCRGIPPGWRPPRPGGRDPVAPLKPITSAHDNRLPTLPTFPILTLKSLCIPRYARDGCGVFQAPLP